MALAPWTPWLLPAAVGWVIAYPVSYYAAARIRFPRPVRFQRPLAIWVAAAVPFAGALVVARPWLVWVGLAYMPAFALNIAFARHGDGRSLANDAIFIIQCAAIIPVSWGIGAIPGGWSPVRLTEMPAAVLLGTGLCVLILLGSTLHVKSLIRERRDPRYAFWSRAWAVASLALAVAAAIAVGVPHGLTLIVPFIYLLARSLWLANPRMSPARIGMLELAGFALMAGLAPLAL